MTFSRIAMIIRPTYQRILCQPSTATRQLSAAFYSVRLCSPQFLNKCSDSVLKSQFSYHQSRIAPFGTKPKEGNGRKRGAMFKLAASSFGIGVLVTLGYYYRKLNTKYLPIANLDSGNDLLFAEAPPAGLVTKKVFNPNDDSGLEITLYQYQPCPFCGKVRAFLDFYGLSYNIVEVNPVTKKQLYWSAYKKVPTIIAKIKEGHQQLNDSTVIISCLSSYLMRKDQGLLNTVKCYPKVDYIDDNGTIKSEIMNSYFLMIGDINEDNPHALTKEAIVEERKWRRWADNVLMHTLSPNIYRTWDESVDAFYMFSKYGDWERIFPNWERLMVIYVGAAVMYVIGKRLKKRHNISDDVRSSLYEQVNHFIKAVQKKKTLFLGGNQPNLADLAVYACLHSIEGSRAFDDVLNNTKIAPWYNAMQEEIKKRRGQDIPV